MNTIISTISNASFDVLFGANLTGFAIAFILYLIFHFIVSFSDARKTAIDRAKNNDKQQDQNIDYSATPDPPEVHEIIYTSKPHEQKKKRNLRKPQPQLPIDIIDDPTKDQKNTRRSLARELPQQGHGSRFEAAPGTLNAIQLAPTVEATVNPDLDSLTGIYDQPAQSSNDNSQSQNAINLYNILTTPEGVRNSVVLSEILNRPQF
ncbi:MAG: hypothetical protein LBT09_04770 [Planctomycetaceae bacterium]|jgi:hypothetical protein|nr:hypothetical protein [Planctomycetaceae bacterium]